MNPFYVDEQLFKDLKLSRNELARQLNLNGSNIENKCIIGSFQRDSRGDDLSKSKWHKNPEMMLDILNRLDKTKIILLLAGPRRHFIIRECRKHGIPYIFYGDESFIDKNLDDVSTNTVSYEKINLLYNLSDLCLLTSASEGGPKAVIEAGLTKTLVLCTPVGFAPDLLDPQSICTTTDEFRLKIESMISNPNSVDDLIQKNYENVSKINNFEAYKQRIKHIIDTVSNE
jgi:glycosyltransferase involved in cell wall biosynthesis